MKFSYLFLLLLSLSCTSPPSSTVEQNNPTPIAIIPQPQSIQQGEGYFQIDANTTIIANTQPAQQIADYIQEKNKNRHRFSIAN